MLNLFLLAPHLAPSVPNLLLQANLLQSPPETSFQPVVFKALVVSDKSFSRGPRSIGWFQHAFSVLLSSAFSDCHKNHQRFKGFSLSFGFLDVRPKVLFFFSPTEKPKLVL